VIFTFRPIYKPPYLKHFSRLSFKILLCDLITPINLHLIKVYGSKIKINAFYDVAKIQNFSKFTKICQYSMA